MNIAIPLQNIIVAAQRKSSECVVERRGQNIRGPWHPLHLSILLRILQQSIEYLRRVQVQPITTIEISSRLVRDDFSGILYTLFIMKGVNQKIKELRVNVNIIPSHFDLFNGP